MRFNAVSYIYACLYMLVVDVIWVTVQSKYGVYKNQIDNRFRSTFFIGAVWAIIILSSAFFLNVFRHPNSERAFTFGFFTGMLAYLVFNGTAVIAFKKYGVVAGVVDTLWGGILWGTTSLIIHKAKGRENDIHPSCSSLTYLDI